MRLEYGCKVDMLCLRNSSTSIPPLHANCYGYEVSVLQLRANFYGGGRASRAAGATDPHDGPQVRRFLALTPRRLCGQSLFAMWCIIGALVCLFCFSPHAWASISAVVCALMYINICLFLFLYLWTCICLYIWHAILVTRHGR
jgi:hypothetical protein